MFRPRRATKTDARRGIILLVVLALLTLFAIVGISFVLYANAEADASRIYREAQGFTDLRPDIPADQLLNFALSQSVYDVDDRPGSTSDHLYSAMRGHSFARDMYGWDSDNTSSNIYPFNGTGRFHGNITSTFNDEFNLINYEYFPADGFIRDPERYGNRTGAGAANAPLQPYTGGWNSPYTFPDLNHCYLAAVDSNGNVLTPSFVRAWNPFGTMDPSNPNWNTPSSPGTATADLKYMVLRPRPADMATGFPLPLKDPATGAVGDVQNAVGITKSYDSFWMDLDYPVQTAPDGTKFKPLFAFLIMDLDNRINLNTAGNVRGGSNAHASNRGYGPWEVNPRQLPSGSGGNQWPQLYLGYSPAAPAQPVAGRYGGPTPANQPQPVPGGPAPGGSAPGGPLPHVYAQTDFDAATSYSYPNNSATQTGLYSPPSGTSCFPTFPPGYENGSSTVELLNHPLLYNVFSPTPPNRRFPLSDMNLLLNNGTSGTLWQSSNFGQLCPALFSTARLRNLVTTDSYDVNRPGLMPWIWDQTASGYTANTSDTYGPPSGSPVALPGLTSRNTPGTVPSNSDFRTPGQSSNTGPNAVDWRWNVPTVTDPISGLAYALNKVDLNRFLPPYPHMGSGTSPATYSNQAMPNSAPPWTPNTPVWTQFMAAQNERVRLANDIYRCFLATTGLPQSPGNPNPPDLPQRRWLAQLAVNIVDYIDEDDISTPFNFFTAADAGNPMGFNVMATTANANGGPNELLQYWVFGTEMPRVILNEVYAEFQHPTMTTGSGMMMTTTGKSGNFNVRVWAELYNPLPGSLPGSVQQQDGNAVPLYVNSTNGSYATYQVMIASSNNTANSRGLLLPASGQNVLGTPDTASSSATCTAGIRAQTTDADFGIAATNLFGGGTTNGPPSLKPQEVLILGPAGNPDSPDPAYQPHGPDVESTINVYNPASAPNGQVPSGKQYVTGATANSMQYQVYANWNSGTMSYKWYKTDQTTPANDRLTSTTPPAGGITVLLRRLTNPYVTHQTDPTAGNPYQGNYNPYMTVDYLDHVNLNDYTYPNISGYAPAFPTRTNPMTPVTTPARPSRAKQQPFAADFSQTSQNPQYPSNPPAPAAQQTPTLHNLGVVPNNPSANYDWLVHLDRQLISPAELLQVSAYAPFLLTHQFITQTTGMSPTTQKWTHRAPWFDEPQQTGSNWGVPSGQSARLYRALEFLDVHSRAAGVGFTGRVPGRVNINTIWDPETFSALCDAPSSVGSNSPNYFSQNDVTTIWNQILASRSTPGSSASPFMGMAVPNSPGGDPWLTNASGIDNTLLRRIGGQGGTPLLQITNGMESSVTHPYQQNELLTKILNNVTTRSNVFAVWVTVGFFQVVQDTDAQGNPVRPVKLGAEIGLSTNTNIRHRLFAIVDRSQMAIDQQVTTLTAAVTPTNPPGPVPVNLAATSGTTSNTNITWGITPGTVLLVGTGAGKEAVLVTAVNGTQITAVFQQAHGAQTPVTIPGNPGPQPGFSVHDPRYQDVVPYFAIMQ